MQARFASRLTATLAFAITALFAAATPARAADDLTAACPDDVPDALVPPADQRLRYVVPAVGVQIYACIGTASGGTSWLFIAPDANRVDDEEGDLIGTHANISMIQRLNTVGGLAPAASACNASTIGTIAQVPYTTDYFLYDTRPTNGTNPQCR